MATCKNCAEYTWWVVSADGHWIMAESKMVTVYKDTGEKLNQDTDEGPRRGITIVTGIQAYVQHRCHSERVKEVIKMNKARNNAVLAN